MPRIFFDEYLVLWKSLDFDSVNALWIYLCYLICIVLLLYSIVFNAGGEPANSAVWDEHLCIFEKPALKFY